VANILDNITGIFSNLDDKDAQKKTNPNDEEQQKLYDIVWQDYQVFKGQREPVEEMWRKEQRFYGGDHWYGLRPPEVSKMRPNDVENVAWSQIESIVAKLTGWVPEPDFEAQEPNDEGKAEMLTEYIPYEMNCISFKQKHIRAVRRMVIHGPLVYKVVYDPTVEGGKGNNRYIGNNDIIPVDLGTFFPDPRIKDFIYLQKGQAHIFHSPQTLDYFKERFPKRGQLVQQDNLSDDVEIFGNNNESSNDDFSIQKSERSGLIEYLYKGKPKVMTAEDKKLFKELAQENLAEGKDPSENLAKAAGTMKGVHCIYISTSGVFLEHKAYVYDHGQYPIIARTLFPDEGNPWGKGYMRDMIAPQIMLNKYSELGVEIMAKMGNPAIVYEETAITKPDVWKRKRSEPGAMLPVNDMNGWKETQGSEIPQTVFEALNYYKDMLQKIPGQFDSANGQASSNVTSGEQAKALIAASSGRLALSAEIIQDALEEVYMQYIELMAQFYTSERVVRVTGKQMSVSRDSIVNSIPTEYETGNQVPHPDTGEMIDEKVPVQEEYVPKFDIKVNIGVDKPKDREYMIQMAFNLFNMLNPATQMPFIDAKAVEYAVENGRMEPFSVINDRMQQEQQQMQQMQQLQQQLQQLQQENQVMQDMLVEAQQNGDTSHIEALKHLNESDKLSMQQQQQEHSQRMQQQQQAHSQQMDVTKLGLEQQKIQQMGQKQGVGAR
jgi:hypothetical protein